MLVFSTDKKRLLTHFQKDEVLFSYHIGDLDEFFFNDCQWFVDYADRARIEECLLLYTALEKPAVIAFGLTDRFDELLEESLPLLPAVVIGVTAVTAVRPPRHRWLGPDGYAWARMTAYILSTGLTCASVA